MLDENNTAGGRQDLMTLLRSGYPMPVFDDARADRVMGMYMMPLPQMRGMSIAILSYVKGWMV